MKTTTAFFILALIIGDAFGAAMTPGNLLFVRSGIAGSTLSSSSNRVFLDEYTWDGTFVQTHDPGATCVTRNSRYTGGVSLSTDNKLVVLSCYIGTAGTSITSMPRAAVTMDGTGAVIDTTSFTTSNSIYSAYVDGSDVWIGNGNSLAYLTRGATSATVTNVLAGAVTRYDMQIVDGTFYTSNWITANYLVGKAASIPKVANVAVTAYITSATTTATPGYMHIYDKNTIYMAFEVTVKGISKIVDDGSGSFTKYTTDSPGSLACNGVYAIDRQGTRYVYFTSDNAVHRATDNGTAFTDVITLVSGLSSQIRYHDVVRVPHWKCFNGAKDQDETDVDCGGTVCGNCAAGKICNVNGDCLGDCVSNVCVATCSDAVKNQDESDVDCGGSCTTKCANDKACNTDDDCFNFYCNPDKVCKTPTCSDGVKNLFESDIDCGGTICDLCGEGKSCTGNDDCLGDCVSNVCVATCADTVKNQDESDIDCGGAICTNCGEGKTCNGNDDCLGDCVSNVCVATCSDTVKNQDETDTDCGGAICGDCGEGKTCNGNDDCLGDCVSNVCVATCSDTVKNQDESDVDCGGSCATKCADDKTCNSESDCTNNYCNLNGVCKTPTCSDGVKNQDETDIDCDGTTCSYCIEGQACIGDENCLGDCVSNVCVATCFDTVKNQDESDVDCGGLCSQCTIDQACNSNSDCMTNFCNSNNVCKSASCDDSAQNQDETDVDCGGSACSPCSDGQSCALNSDCESDNCVSNVCDTPVVPISAPTNAPSSGPTTSTPMNTPQNDNSISSAVASSVVSVLALMAGYFLLFV